MPVVPVVDAAQLDERGFFSLISLEEMLGHVFLGERDSPIISVDIEAKEFEIGGHDAHLSAPELKHLIKGDLTDTGALKGELIQPPYRLPAAKPDAKAPAIRAHPMIGQATLQSYPGPVAL